uniref:Ig-like domain-containing protein n=1 Tax=Sarcophilus harrisii TaxID=9305 RepID=A0A7N4NHH5_SARHA
MSPSCPETTMETKLLGWLAICLLGTGLTDCSVLQTPRYLVKGIGEVAILKCNQDHNYDDMYWYQHKPGQELKQLLRYFKLTDVTKEKDISENFQVARPNINFCYLNISSLSLEDSATYLCSVSL